MPLAIRIELGRMKPARREQQQRCREHVPDDLILRVKDLLATEAAAAGTNPSEATFPPA